MYPNHRQKVTRKWADARLGAVTTLKVSNIIEFPYCIPTITTISEEWFPYDRNHHSKRCDRCCNPRGRVALSREKLKVRGVFVLCIPKLLS